MKYCAYDGGSDTMNYYPDGNAPEDTDEHEWEVYGYIWDSSEIAYWNSIQLDGYEYRAGVSVLEDLSAILVERRKL